MSTAETWNETSLHLLVGVLFLQHDGQPLQEGPHAGGHVEADDALLLQGRAASGQHVIGRHELFGAVHNQHILDGERAGEETYVYSRSSDAAANMAEREPGLTFDLLEQTATPTSGIQTMFWIAPEPAITVWSTDPSCHTHSGMSDQSFLPLCL